MSYIQPFHYAFALSIGLLGLLEVALVFAVCLTHVSTIPLWYENSQSHTIFFIDLNKHAESLKSNTNIIVSHDSSVEKMDQFYGIIEHEYYYNDDKTHPTDSFFPVSIAFVNC